MASISSYDIISVVVYDAESKGWLDPKIFLCIPASAGDAAAAAANPNGIKTLLANGWVSFVINSNLVFNNLVDQDVDQEILLNILS